MIKYLELTAPEESQFRQAKIISVLIKEGDEVAAGDPLFKVMSGSSEVDLPSRLAGRIIELIVEEGENISLMTPLVLLETEVEKRSASKPISDSSELGTEAAVNIEEANTTSKEAKLPSDQEIENSSVETQAPSKGKGKPRKKEKGKNSKEPKTKKKNLQKEAHQQQSLNLDDTKRASADDDQNNNKPNSANVASDHNPLNNQTAQPATSSNMSENKIAVPDIGIDRAKVIEILVQVGDSVSVDDLLITLESDKASMDVPSTAEGIVESIAVSVDQDVSEGDILIVLSGAKASDGESASNATTDTPATNEQLSNDKPAAPPAKTEQTSSDAQIVEVTIPDIGGDSAKVIEVFVKQGQTVDVEEPLVTLESDKASMDVPSTVAGVIKSIEVQLDQEVSEGTLVVTISSSYSAQPSSSRQQETKNPVEVSKPDDSKGETTNATPPDEANAAAPEAAAQAAKPSASKSHASPSVRRFARELGADLGGISGTGRKGRVTKDDVKLFVKGVLNSKAAPSSSTGGVSEAVGIPAVPAVDFTKFGEIDIQPLNKIKKLTAANLHRSWLNVPHVTHSDESNISDLESFRKQLNDEYAKQGKEIKLSPLAFIVKAVVNALQTFPQFNSSLEPGGENLIYKKYFHIGIAVETPNGLVVPVIRNGDTKSVAELAAEMGDLAGKARNKKLTPADMSGACFTISSLGGIGGTGFTPIVNAPEVAILGVSRSKMQPVWNGEEFEPGMILPLSLSYDHRVIDGAEAARFTRHVAAVLEDVRRLAV